jgi:hypothetical protein
MIFMDDLACRLANRVQLGRVLIKAGPMSASIQKRPAHRAAAK